MANAARLNGMWIGKSFDRAIEECQHTMKINADWPQYNDVYGKRAYEAAARRLAQLQAAQAA